MKNSDDGFSKDNLQLLVDGNLPWEEVKKAIRLSPKDANRFTKYLELLQAKHSNPGVVAMFDDDADVEPDSSQDRLGVQMERRLHSSQL